MNVEHEDDSCTTVDRAEDTAVPTDSPRSAAVRRLLTLLAAVLALATGLVPSAAAIGGPVVPGSYFGLHDSGLSASSFPRLPVGSLRLWDVGTSWRDVQPESGGPWQVAKLDGLVAAALTHHATPILVLGGTPAWASARNTPHQPCASAGFLGTCAADPPTPDAWAAYVRFMVARYSARGVHTYEVWNEPNVLRFWNGTPTQMAALSNSAVRTIRAGDRRATILSPAFVLRLPTQQRYFAAYVRTRALSRVDAVSLHLYPTADQGPEATIDLLTWSQKLMARHGLRKPVWNTEVNFGLAGGLQPQMRAVSPALGAAYLARTYLLSRSAGVGQVSWYAYTHNAILGVQMTEPDNVTLTAVGRAFTTTRRWMAGQRLDGCTHDRHQTYRCTLRTARTLGYVYWNPTTYRPIVKAPVGTYQFESLGGAIVAQHAGGRLRVGQAPVLVRVHR